MRKIGDQTLCEAKAQVTQPHQQTANRQSRKKKRKAITNLQHASKFAQHTSSRAAFPTPTGRRECCANKASMRNKANKQAGKQNWTMKYLSEDDGRSTKAWCKAKAKVTQPKRKDSEKQTGKAQKQKHCESATCKQVRTAHLFPRGISYAHWQKRMLRKQSKHAQQSKQTSRQTKLDDEIPQRR